MATETITEVLPDAAGNMPVDVQNWPAPITSVSVSNFPAAPANSPPFASPPAVSVNNFPAAPANSPPFAAPVPVTQSGTWTVSATFPGSIAVSNFPTSFNVGNFPSGFNINNWPAGPAPAQLLSPAVGAANFNTGQAQAGTTVSILVPARVGAPGTGRVKVVIVNETGTDKVFLGNSGVTAANAFILPAVAGESVTIESMAAIWGMSPTTTQNLSWYETY